MKANEIIKGLWIGGIDSLNQDFFKNFNIKANINCTKDVDCPNIKGVDYYRVPVHDTLKKKDFEQMIQFLPNAIDFIHKKRDIEGKNILINCYLGAQRSCCVATVYLSLHHKMTIQDALSLILARRPVAFHNGKHINFIESIKFYIKDKKKPKTIKYI